MNKILAAFTYLVFIEKTNRAVTHPDAPTTSRFVRGSIILGKRKTVNANEIMMVYYYQYKERI